jgi:hypothetical protein
VKIVIIRWHSTSSRRKNRKVLKEGIRKENGKNETK